MTKQQSETTKMIIITSSRHLQDSNPFLSSKRAPAGVTFLFGSNIFQVHTIEGVSFFFSRNAFEYGWLCSLVLRRGFLIQHAILVHIGYHAMEIGLLQKWGDTQAAYWYEFSIDKKNPYGAVTTERANNASRTAAGIVSPSLRKLVFHFLSNWMGYDRGDSFPFDFEPNENPFG